MNQRTKLKNVVSGFTIDTLASAALGAENPGGCPTNDEFRIDQGIRAYVACFLSE